jgi:S-adenosyl methyltransferase
MSETPLVPPGVDPAVPSPARMYDYALGGKLSYQADRDAVESMRPLLPEILDGAWANRGFHQRAVRWLARQGISQFLDIGSGLPTVGNTHEVVLPINPDARIVYVDNDPLVSAHAEGLLSGSGRTRVVMADLREPQSVLDNPGVRALIDFSRPTGLLMTAVMHFVAPASDPWGLVARYVQALAGGSYLVLSHVTDEGTPPATVAAAVRLYERASENLYFRSWADVRRFFSGLELVSPDPATPADVVHVGVWGAEDPALADTDGSRWMYCGVGRRP